MPYKFGEYVSTYVDPQSAKISETLRNRFIENFQANDKLALAIDQMQAALPFENDVLKKQELQRKIENDLTLLAERGDYENLGMPIHKTAKDFSKEYAPIQENYKRYSQYVNDFNEALKKGDYNPEQQKYLSQYMLKTANGPYKGFEIDPETGRVKEGSLFTGPTIYKDPKIMDRVTERLKILHEQKTGSTVQRVGQGPDGSLVIESGGTTSQIPQSEVDKVIQAVMAESDVKAYVDQLSDMKTYSFQANGQLPQVFEAQVKGYTGMLTELNNTLNSGGLSSSQRAQVKAQITAVTQELNSLKEASQDENLMYAHIQGKIKDEIWKPIKEYASLKGGIYEQTSTYKESYDALWLDDYKRQKDFEEKYGTPMYEMSEVNATIYGETIEEQMKVAGDKERMAQELEQKAGDLNNGLSTTVRQSMLAQAQSLRTEAGIINQGIKAAGDMAYSIQNLESADKNIMEVVKEMYPNKSAGEYGLIINRIFDNTGDQDYIDFKNAWNKKASSGWKINISGGSQEVWENADFDRYISFRYGATGSSETLAEATWRAGGDQSKIQGPGDNFYGDDYYHYTDLIAGFDAIKERFSTPFTNSSAKLAEVKLATPLISGVLPGRTDQESRIVTQAADTYFKDRGLNVNLTVIDTETGETKTGAELNQFTTKHYAYNTQTGNWHLTMEGKGSEGVQTRKTVILSGEQVGNDVLRAWQNSPSTKFSNLITRHDTGVKGETREFGVNQLDSSGNRTGKQITVKVESQGAGQQPLIQFYDPTINVDAAIQDRVSDWKKKNGNKEISESEYSKIKKEVESKVYSPKMYSTEQQVREITGVDSKTGLPLFEF